MGYKKDLDAVFNYFNDMPNFFLAGRVGAFKYMAIDECMEAAAILVNNLKGETSIKEA